jgi:hypothetical protein
MSELDVHDANALAREHGGVVCFVSGDDHELTSMAVLSYWQSPVPTVVLLRVQNEENDLIMRVNRRDLLWLFEQSAQELREGDDW